MTVVKSYRIGPLIGESMISYILSSNVNAFNVCVWSIARANNDKNRLWAR